MITLGIECTCHTLGIGIIKDGKVLSNIHDIYKPQKGAGILPRDAADHHSQVFADMLLSNLANAKIGIDEIGLIAFSQGPGLGAPLSVGLAGAKYIASLYGKKLIGVNHPFAHIKISEHLSNLRDSLIVYVSGGNTQILTGRDYRYNVLGETLDIGIGNLFDSFARSIKLEYAHGSSLSELAEGGSYISLPYTVKGMNLAFSGLLSHTERHIGKYSDKDLAYSLMETSFAMVAEAAERALFLTKKKSLVVCGGVAQNKRLQEMLKKMCTEDGVKFGVAADEYNRDNGAMIAYAGELLFKKFGGRPIDYWKILPGYRIEMIEDVFK